MQAGASAIPGLALWGAGHYRDVSGEEDGVDLRGEVVGARLGAEARPRPRWLAGLSADWSRGRFDWRTAEASGRYAVELAGLWPYAGWVSKDRAWRAWGMLGYGSGRVRLTEETGSTAERGDLDLAAAALGASRALWRGAGAGGAWTLRAKADASAAQLKLDGAAGRLESLTVDVQRLRLGLEARQERELPGGGRVAPSLALAARGDFGDGEDRLGLEVGAGLNWLDPGRGLSLDGRGRLLALSDEGSEEEWGVDLALHYDPGVGRRGLVLEVRTGYGAAESEGRLWRPDAGAMLSSEDFAAQARVEARLGWGLARRDGGLLTPYGRFGLGGTDAWEAGVGAGWVYGDGLRIDLEGGHRGGEGRAQSHLSLAVRAAF